MVYLILCSLLSAPSLHCTWTQGAITSGKNYGLIYEYVEYCHVIFVTICCTFLTFCKNDMKPSPLNGAIFTLWNFAPCYFAHLDSHFCYGSSCSQCWSYGYYHGCSPSCNLVGLQVALRGVRGFGLFEFLVLAIATVDVKGYEFYTCIQCHHLQGETIFNAHNDPTCLKESRFVAHGV